MDKQPEIYTSVSGIGLKLYTLKYSNVNFILHVKVCPPAHNYEHEAGSYGDGFT
jgi:hypothetical protein